MKKFYLWIALAFVFIGSAWADDIPTNITAQHAIEIARQYAINQGVSENNLINNDRFDINSSARYVSDKGQWFVVFDQSKELEDGRRAGPVGGDIVVIVSADGEPLRIIWGW